MARVEAPEWDDAMPNKGKPAGGIVATRVPARLDRLPFGAFHLRIIFALGITWVLDGLEVTLAGSLAGALIASPRLRFTDWDVGLAASFYLVGAVVGALAFGWATDRYGRKQLFFVTLGLYTAATAATAFSFDLASFCLFRFLTGAGIGGEYSAINSTIQEFTPAGLRGRIDLAINGSFWIGAALGAGTSILVLNPARFAPDSGWRFAFFIGALLGLVILALRRLIPESPRWLVIRGKTKEAEKIVGDIEEEFSRRNVALSNPEDPLPLRIKARSHTPLREVAKDDVCHLSRREHSSASCSWPRSASSITPSSSPMPSCSRHSMACRTSRSAGMSFLSRSGTSWGRCCSGRSSTRSAAKR